MHIGLQALVVPGHTVRFTNQSSRLLWTIRRLAIQLFVMQLDLQADSLVDL
jgi:hypothetical protein